MPKDHKSNLKITDKLNIVKKQNTYEIIVEQIEELILSGELKPGEKLPGERVLSTKLGSSRTSVRLAIKLLEFMNLLEVRPGSGVYVVPKDILEKATINNKIQNLIVQHPLMDLIEARKCFEPFMAALAAENSTAEEIAEMENNLESMEKRIEKGEEIIKQAVTFHELIYKASKNIILNQIGLIIHNLSDESKRVTLLKYEHTVQSLNGHKKILSAIKAHDSNLASEYMLEHLTGVEKHLKINVKKSATTQNLQQ